MSITLEGIKARKELMIRNGYDLSLSNEDINYLIEQVDKMQKLEKFKQYFDELYGQGLEIVNWHMNDDTELFDNFYESAVEHMEENK